MSQKIMGFIGLGRMGLPMARLLSKEFEVIAYDQCDAIDDPDLTIVDSLLELVSRLQVTKGIWLMGPAGAVSQVLEQLAPLLGEGDAVIDGGNSDVEDSIRHRHRLEALAIHHVEVGCSGGIKGAQRGPPMTVSGSSAALERVRPVLEALGGHYTCYDRPGYGHLAKGIHNAIEYGMMQSIAEGVALYFEHGFTQQQIIDTFTLWQQGSIIESRLVGTALTCLQAHDFSEKRTIAHSETVDLVDNITVVGVPRPA